MSLSRADVEKVSLLARLQFNSDELDTLTEQLGRIVAYVEQLAEVNTDTAEPMAHALDLANVFAADEPRPSLAREAALQNAPKKDDACYRVPAVLGD